MDTGLVVQTTPSLTAVLGYPREMWTGRSITDFVHPEDRDHLIRQITLNIHKPIDAITETSTIRYKSRNFFCRMRQYSGLKSSSKVRERKKNFLVLKICICFSEVEVAATRRQTVSDGLGILLFLTAITPRSLPPTRVAGSQPNIMPTVCGHLWMKTPFLFLDISPMRWRDLTFLKSSIRRT